jgi:hypothetical protein
MFLGSIYLGTCLPDVPFCELDQLSILCAGPILVSLLCYLAIKMLSSQCAGLFQIYLLVLRVKHNF